MARRNASALALELFDPEETITEARKPALAVKTAKLKGSYSKRGVLEQCPRKFYYQYYGAHQNKAKSDLEKQRLRQLKVTAMLTLQTKGERQ